MTCETVLRLQIHNNVRGRSRIFIGGGGGELKIMYAHAHYEREVRSPLVPGSARARLRALGDCDALSCYLSPIFTHSDTKWDIKIYSRSNFRGGGRLLRHLKICH